MVKAQEKGMIQGDYLTLVRRFPLRPIRSKKELAEAHKIIDALSIRGEDDLSRDELDYLLVLGDQVSRYEDDVAIDEPQSGLVLLKHLVEANDLNASDIGRIVGQRELGSKILRGERQISRNHAVALGQHFGLPGEVFLRPM